MPIPIIFDTDAGSDIDDLYALALLLRHPDVELLGVTTVSGDRNATAALRLQNLPVELAGSLTRGMTVTSPWTLEAALAATEAGPGDILVSNQIDAETIKSRFVDLVISDTLFLNPGAEGVGNLLRLNTQHSTRNIQ